MTAANVSRRSILVNGHVDRIDAEFFVPELVAREQRLEKAGAVPLGTISSPSGVRVDPSVGTGESFPYLEISAVDTRDGFALAEDVLRSEAPSRAQIGLRSNDVALSSVRPSRNAVILIPHDLDRAVGSSGLIVLRATAVQPEVLFVLLKTRIAASQLDRRARASMYPTVNPSDVSSIRLPSLSDGLAEDVIDLVHRAAEARRRFLDEHGAARAAAEAFFGRMGQDALLRDLAVHREWPLKRSEVFGAGTPRRLDAEFYSPAYALTEQRMERTAQLRSLGSLASLVTTGRTPAADAYLETDKGGAVVVKVATLTNLGVNWASAEFAGTEFLGHADSAIVEGDVLFTSSAHSPPHIAKKADVVSAIPPEFHGRATIAGELMRVRLKEDDSVSPEYLAAFIRSPLGGEQIRRCTRGMTSHVYAEDLKTYVRVPMPPDDVAAAIKDHVGRATAERWRFRSLIRTAVDLVDEHVDRILSDPRADDSATTAAV